MNSSHENPIDEMLISCGKKLYPIFFKFGFTPNLITTLSLIFNATGVYYISKFKFRIGAVLFFIGYFFDCLDGNFARTYNLTSKFGDYYDHLTDIITYVYLIYTIYNINIPSTLKKYLLLLMVISVIPLSIDLGCKERHSEEKQSLSVLKYLCPKKEYVHFTKFFGSGTAILVISLIIFILPELI